MLSKGQNWAVKIMTGVNERDGERRETEQRKEMLGLIKCRERKGRKNEPIKPFNTFLLYMLQRHNSEVSLNFRIWVPHFPHISPGPGT